MCLKVLTSSFVKKQIKNLFTPSKFAKMVLLSIVNNRIKNRLNKLIANVGSNKVLLLYYFVLKYIHFLLISIMLFRTLSKVCLTLVYLYFKNKNCC